MHKKIMIVVDDSELTPATVREGLEVARAYSAEVIFYYMMPSYVVPMSDMAVPVEWTPEKHYEAAREIGEQVLSEAVAAARNCLVRSSFLVGTGSEGADSIVSVANSRKCDLIVIGSRGRTAVQRLLFGSVVTRLITLAAMPVLVCKKTSLHRTPMEEFAPLPKNKRARRSATRESALV